MNIKRNWTGIFAFLAFCSDVGLAFFNTQIVWWFMFGVIGRSQPIHATWQLRWLVPCILTAIMIVQRSFSKAFKQPLSDQFLALCRMSGYGLLATMALVFLTKGFLYSRGYIFSYYLLAPVALLAGRWLLHLANRPLMRRGWGLQHSVIIGTGRDAMTIIDHLILNKAIGYRLAGCLASSPEDLSFWYRGIGAVGLTGDFDGTIGGRQVEQVFVPGLIPEIDRYQPVIDLCQRKGINLRLVSHQIDILLRAVRISDVAGVSLVKFDDDRLQRLGHGGKRLMDLIVSGVALAILSPLFAVIALLIKLDSPGGIFYGQQRIGMGGRPFTILKFRTMRAGAELTRETLSGLNEVEGPIFKMRKDPRITVIGRALRRLSLDELPQLVNVWRGEMSLVGPRPALPDEVARYYPWHAKRYSGPQGMTGLWQVSGRSELTFEEMALLDIYYLENWSFLLDLEILFRTIPAVLLGGGAY